MALPKWLLPAGLAALVVGGLAYIRRPSPKVGDVVGVPVSKLLDAAGNPLPLLTLPPSLKVALAVNNVDGANLRGDAVGTVDPSSLAIVRANVPIGVGPFGFPVDAVTDLYRGPIGAEKRI